MNKDPYKELLTGEDLGTGISLGFPFSAVPAKVVDTLGRRFADRNVSMDIRYYKFMDDYSDYALVVGDMDQDGKVDAIAIAVYAQSGEPEQKVQRFRNVFPKVHTKTGITIGDDCRDVVEAYQTVKHHVRDSTWIHSSAGHLHFHSHGDLISGIWLLDDESYQRPIVSLLGSDYV